MGPWDLSWLWNKLCDSGKVMGPLCAPVSLSVGMDHAVFRVSLCSGAQNQDPEPLLGERSGHKVETPVTGQEVTLGMVTFWGSSQLSHISYIDSGFLNSFIMI